MIAFVARGSVTEGDEAQLGINGTRDPQSVKPAYHRWLRQSLPEGDWVGVVVAVHPAQLLDPADGASRHVLTTPPEGDLAVVRVYDGSEPVLSDVAFEARRRSVEGALTQ